MKFWDKVKLMIEDKSLRKKVLFVLGALIVFRLLAAVPIPGIDAARIQGFLANNQFFGILNLFSGGGLSNLSVIMLGVGPYVTASIIMQVLTIVVPRLKVLYSESGEAGKKKFTQYSRLLTIPLAFIQGFSLLVVFTRQGIIPQLTAFQTITNLFVMVAGSLLLMWIGELISEYGIGNGVSLLIFAGIVSALPTHINQLIFTFDQSQLPLYILFVALAVVVVIGVVVVTEAERAIPVTYAKQVRGSRVTGGTSTYLPLRINQAGVIPIIFALSILLFPQIIANFLAGSTKPILLKISGALTSFLQTTWLYALVYFLFVFVFTYFYTAVTFDPDAISKNLQKNGAFIPGVRPGEPTANYLSFVLGRITMFGALFLGLIAVLPVVMKAVTGITAVALGGTALLIVVSVILDLVKKVDAQVSMREY